VEEEIEEERENRIRSFSSSSKVVVEFNSSFLLSPYSLSLWKRKWKKRERERNRGSRKYKQGRRNETVEE
jgi:hypothetical protein